VTNSAADSPLVLKLSRGTAVILIIVYGLFIYFQLSTHKHIFEDKNHDDSEQPSISLYAAIFMLLVITALIAYLSELLVGSIEGLSTAWGLSETFVGFILLPIVGNAAEHLTAVTVAMKNKMELSIGIGLGSSMYFALYLF
jgi:Ca2+:H+ antiporter